MAVVRASTPTTTGTVDFTVSGFGTPKAAMFFMLYSPGSDGSASYDQLHQSIGFTDGTRDRSATCEGRNARATTQTGRASRNAVACQVASQTASVRKEGTFNSWITDGVRIDWTITGGTESLELVCVLFGGGDLTAYVNDINVQTTTSTTDPGFKPDLVFFAGDAAGQGGGYTTHSILSFGAAVRGSGDSITQTCVTRGDENGQSTTDVTSVHFTDHIASQTLNGATNWKSALTSWDASGFTVTPAAGTGGDDAAYLALEFGGGSVTLINDFETGTSATTVAYTTAATPQAIIGCMSSLQAADSMDTGAQSESLAFFAATASAEFSQCASADDNNTDSNYHALSDTKSLSVGQDTASGYVDLAVATLDSLNATDFTLDYSTAPATSIYGWAVAIEEGDAGGEFLRIGMTGGMKELTGGMNG